jgi:long-chain acyl-CoA synthetase
VNVTQYLLSGKDRLKTSLLFAEGQHTYAELTDDVERGAQSLVADGHQKGDRILLLADNSYFWVTAYLSTLRAGMVCVPLPATISTQDLESIIASTEPLRAFMQARHAQKYRQQIASISLSTEKDFPPTRPVAGQVQIAESGGRDLAALMFTSGSTGKPRGVMVSHQNIVANTDSIIAALRLLGRDRIMAVLPFHYCFGTSLLHTHLRIGGSIVVDRRFMFPEAVLQRMRETECTGFAGVPSHYQILLRRSSLRRTEFPHLRYVQQAGGHLAPTFVRELRDALPDKLIFIMYGQTEATARLTTLSPDILDKKPHSIGKPIPGVKLYLLDETGQEVRPGQVGEIVAEGENITHGYWRDPELTSETFRAGRLRTGDLATIDEEGYFYIVDRTRDFLKCGGKRVSSRQLEDLLVEHEAVLEAAIVGIPDEVLGEAVKAFVVPRIPGNDEDLASRLLQFCKQRIAPPFQPKQIAVLSSLPRSSSGKILKSLLRNGGVQPKLTGL